MKALQIIHTAYRATSEEQDDTIVWLCHAMHGAGAQLDVLLCGDAVSYGVEAQTTEDLEFGDWRQTNPPRLARDIASLAAKGPGVFVVADDLDDRGIGDGELMDRLQRVAAGDVAELLQRYDQVWRW